MRVLGIDTSSLLGGVAILDNETLLAESRLNVAVAHSERLMGEMDRMLRHSDLTVKDIDVFAVAVGPGSFTGLRVGLSTVKGLVYATGRPMVAVPTLEALAWNVPFCRYQVCPLLDARKGEVYAGLFKVAAVLATSVVIWRFRRFRSALEVALVMLAVFMGVFFYHVLGMVAFW